MHYIRNGVSILDLWVLRNIKNSYRLIISNKIKAKSSILYLIE